MQTCGPLTVRVEHGVSARLGVFLFGLIAWSSLLAQQSRVSGRGHLQGWSPGTGFQGRGGGLGRSRKRAVDFLRDWTLATDANGFYEGHELVEGILFNPAVPPAQSSQFGVIFSRQLRGIALAPTRFAT